MTGLVTVKDGASIEASNKIIDEYNAQTKREAKAFESLKICRDVYEQTLSDNALNNYENALEWYLKMTDVTENILTILEAYGGEVEWSDWLRVGSPAHPPLCSRRDT